MGKLYGDMYGDTDQNGNKWIEEIDTKSGKALKVSKNMMLRQQEMVHLSSIYGAAESGRSGYDLSQGYREADATRRLIAYVDSMGETATDDKGTKKDIAEFAQDYVDQIFNTRTYYGRKYNDGEADRRLAEGKRVVNNAFKDTLNLDMIEAMDKKDGKKSLILNMEDEVWASALKNLEYDRDIGAVEKQA